MTQLIVDNSWKEKNVIRKQLFLFLWEVVGRRHRDATDVDFRFPVKCEAIRWGGGARQHKLNISQFFFAFPVKDCSDMHEA